MNIGGEFGSFAIFTIFTARDPINRFVNVSMHAVKVARNKYVFFSIHLANPPSKTYVSLISVIQLTLNSANYCTSYFQCIGQVDCYTKN